MIEYKRELLIEMLKGAKKVAIIGVGNLLRGDDVVGLLVAYRLRRLGPKNAVVLIGEVYPENLLGMISQDDEITHVIYIDAVEAGEELGKIFFVEPEELPYDFFETHKLPIRFFMKYLGQYNKKLVILGIQVSTTQINARLSREVFQSAMFLANELYEVLNDL